MKKNNLSGIFLVLFVFSVLLLTGNNVSAKAEEPPSGTPAPSPAADPAGQNAAVSISYKNEEITITSNDKIYYAVLKKDTDTSVKESALLEAAKVNANTYLIDISTIASSKECYVGYTTKVPGTDTTATATVNVIKMIPSLKKIAFYINYGSDSVTGYNLVSKVIVTDADGKTVNYINDPGLTENDSQKKLTEANLPIQWKKGANGEWKKLSDMTPAAWESMQTSGAILYMRVAADDTKPLRYSKEYKVKVARAKAPNMKVDVNRLTLPLRNGFQFRIAGAESWTTVLPYNTKGTASGAYVTGAEYNPATSATSKKITAVPLDTVMGNTPYTMKKAGASGTAITVEVRTAATAAKPASFVTRVVIGLQAPAPVVSVSRTADTVSVDKLEKDPTDPVSGTYNFEFLLMTKADLDKGLLDLEKAAWKNIKPGEKMKNGVVMSQTLSNGEKKTYKITDSGICLVIRRKGIGGSGKTLSVLASEYAVVNLPDASAAATPTPASASTPTPTPDVTPGAGSNPTPTPTPTSTPAPTPTPTPVPAP